MKRRAFIRKICEKCRLRRGCIIVICSNPRHKQWQGLSDLPEEPMYK